jgi:hypothetical protein
MYTLCGTVLRTSYSRIRNYADRDGEPGTLGNFRLSTAGLRQISTAHFITQPQKLHSQLVGLVTAVMYQVAGLTCSFVNGMGLRAADVIHNNLTGDAQHFSPPPLATHQPDHNNGHGPLRYKSLDAQTFLSVHNSRLHSARYTTGNSYNKTLVNNSFLLTNIQYLNVHALNWIRSQTSQWHTNRMVWTRIDKLLPNAKFKAQHTVS